MSKMLKPSLVKVFILRMVHLYYNGVERSPAVLAFQ